MSCHQCYALPVEDPELQPQSIRVWQGLGTIHRVQEGEPSGRLLVFLTRCRYPRHFCLQEAEVFAVDAICGCHLLRLCRGLEDKQDLDLVHYEQEPAVLLAANLIPCLCPTQTQLTCNMDAVQRSCTAQKKLADEITI